MFFRICLQYPHWIKAVFGLLFQKHYMHVVSKVGTFSSDLQNRIRTNPDRKMASNLDLSKLSINRATIILNSIGSLSKMKGSSWTFKRSHSHEGSVSDPGLSSSPPLAEGFSQLPSSKPAPFLSASSAQSAKCHQSVSRSRRKSAHTVLLEDDSSDEPHIQRGEAWKKLSLNYSNFFKWTVYRQFFWI